MANNNTYVIGPKGLFETRFAQNESGEYTAMLIAEGKLPPNSERVFFNKGGIRHSVDDTLVLLEEDWSMYLASDLAREDVVAYTHSEIKSFLEGNTNWKSEELIVH